MTSPFDWWHAGTPEARRALVAASLGWMLDSFDVMLYALVLASIMPDLGLAKSTAGALGSATLLASGAGGLVFGVISDK
jgi:MFS family permease